MDLIYRAQEWLADRVSWIQYPKPRVRSLSGHAHGWRLRWQLRPQIPTAVAMCLPTAMLFVPRVGVYLAITAAVFLFVYFKR